MLTTINALGDWEIREFPLGVFDELNLDVAGTFVKLQE
jgi:hypothetical protein